MDDYGTRSVELLFEQQPTPQCTDIQIVNDSILENDESFSINLTTDVLSVILSPNVATVVIIDNDGKYMITA